MRISHRLQVDLWRAVLFALQMLIVYICTDRATGVCVYQYKVDELGDLQKQLLDTLTNDDMKG